MGKSTLINALVADGISVVPAGGVGPCTAQALIVQYGNTSSFRAAYHSKEKVIGLLATLAKIYEPKASIRQKAKLNSIFNLVSRNELAQIEKNIIGNQDGNKAVQLEYIKQANLLITGEQEVSRSIDYLIDSLYGVVNAKLLFSSRLEKKDVHRIGAIRALLEKGQFECKEGQYANYKVQLHDHATGYLSPILKAFEVRVTSDILKEGLVLVDLPGVGIDGDIHQKVTMEYLANANAIVLVISSKGIGDAEHRLMNTAGIYDKLIARHGSDNARPIQFIIAVTRIDDIVESRFNHNNSIKKCQHLNDVCAEAEKNVRMQLKSLLKAEFTSSTGTSECTGIITQIDKSTDVIPVAAVEFRKLCLKDPDDRPFITHENQSNIPQLRRALSVSGS